ncbi:hypothetical protein BH18ACT9_BH18ACT9_00450 [soil metagenome]
MRYDVPPIPESLLGDLVFSLGESEARRGRDRRAQFVDGVRSEVLAAVRPASGLREVPTDREVSVPRRRG